jgi:hypothetical protein
MELVTYLGFISFLCLIGACLYRRATRKFHD